MTSLRRSGSRKGSARRDNEAISKKIRTGITTSSPSHSSPRHSASETDESLSEGESDLDLSETSDHEQPSYRAQGCKPILGRPRTALTIVNANKSSTKRNQVRVLSPQPLNRSSSNNETHLHTKNNRRHQKSASSASLTEAFASTSLRSSNLSRSRSATQLSTPQKRGNRLGIGNLTEDVDSTVFSQSDFVNAVRESLPDRSRKRKRQATDSTEDDVMSEISEQSEPEQDDAQPTSNAEQASFDFDEQTSDEPGNEYYLHHAVNTELLKLRKDRLTNLFVLLIEDYPEGRHAQQYDESDAHSMSKAALVQAIVDARDEDASIDVEVPSVLTARTRRSSRRNSKDATSSGSNRSVRPTTRSASMTSLAQVGQLDSRPTMRQTRTASFLSQHGKSVDLNIISDISDESGEQEADQTPDNPRHGTPIARRTRSAVRTAFPQVPRSGSTDGHSVASTNDSEEVSLSTRVLRSGKMLVTEPDTIEEEPLVEEVSEDLIGQELLSEDEWADHVDLASANERTLLRLKRDELVRLCRERDIDTSGPKKDLVQHLLAWNAAHGERRLHSDIEGLDEEQSDGSSGSDTDIAAVKRSKQRAKKNETKTQALAQVDTAAPRDQSGRVPLLLDSHRPARQSRPEPQPVSAASGSESSEGEAEAVGLDLESLNLLDKAIAPHQLTRGEKIGSGGFKDVYTGRFRNVKVAIADIRSHLTENEIKELELLRDLRHENIVKLIGVVAYEEPSDIPCSLVTELCLNGDLFDYIRRDVPAPTFDKMLKIMIDTASGLEYLHNRSPKIIHRDMKSSNVLITGRGVAKLTDFGLARVKNSTRSMIKSLVGTVNWQAPELWVPHPRYNEKVDCYATGMIFWECLQWHQNTVKYPFEGMNEHAIYQEVGHKNARPSTAGMAKQWGPDILQLVVDMWAQSSTDRPSMTEVVDQLRILYASARSKAR